MLSVIGSLAGLASVMLALLGALFVKLAPVFGAGALSVPLVALCSLVASVMLVSLVRKIGTFDGAVLLPCVLAVKLP